MMTSNLRRAAIGFALLLFSSLSLAQLVVAPINGTTVTPLSLANALLGSSSGITITNATYTGANGATGTFSGGAGIIGIDTGVLLTSGSVGNVVGPNNDSGASTDNGLPGDAQLTTLAGDPTFDASVLTITFVPAGNAIQFSYVFGSEEYNEFIGAFNDVFGFFVNGVNAALIPGTSTPVAINNLNCGFANPGISPPGTGAHCNLFVNNDPPTHNTQLDGFTTVLKLSASVTPNVPNTLKIAIADTADGALDSAVFIQGGSLTVCGGPGQPPCASSGGSQPFPTLSEMALLLLALLTASIGTALLIASASARGRLRPPFSQLGRRKHE
jgi:hypothetical protein